MKIRLWGCTIGLTALPLLALGADGLRPPAAETLWPQWQARITVQTSALAPLGLAALSDGHGAPPRLRGGAVLGDYVFANPSFGSFRASGGVMMGATASAQPYLGLGYAGTAWGNTLSVSADLGWVAEAPGTDVARVRLGNQGQAAAWREWQLSPVLQLGLRYRF